MENEDKKNVEYYCIDFAQIDDKDYSHLTPREKFFENAATAGKEGFAPGSLRSLRPVSTLFEIEHSLITAFYFQLFLIPTWITVFLINVCLGLVDFTWILYLLPFPVAWFVFTKFWFRSIYDKHGNVPAKIIKEYQHSGADRRNHKYFGMKLVIPKSLRKEAPKESRRIFITVPHGVYPIGLGTALPSHILAKTEGVCRLGVAPILTQMPVLRRIIEVSGSFAAGKKGILEVLDIGDSPQMFIDGIAGMTVCERSETEEHIWFLQRKAICAIAMQANAEIVVGYNFGHTDIWTNLTDPWGLLQKLSIKVNVNVMPFTGRWGIPFAPSTRKPVVVAYGDPIDPKDSNGDVDDLHRRVLEGFQHVFDTHKAAFGWEKKKAVFI